MHMLRVLCLRDKFSGSTAQVKGCYIVVTTRLPPKTSVCVAAACMRAILPPNWTFTRHGCSLSTAACPRVAPAHVLLALDCPVFHATLYRTYVLTRLRYVDRSPRVPHLLLRTARTRTDSVIADHGPWTWFHRCGSMTSGSHTPMDYTSESSMLLDRHVHAELAFSPTGHGFDEVLLAPAYA
ncbi:hypothetical protein WOLCODRAFT_14915 [Wolfiporia cocos MD-104 SS10]|uniref:Uncharacterized protein n=1 Tax=Wolfiporia cocos (strain MD-104) TaxID=742152 RepID=A0A2H3JAW1_WOLCO|nr:hypothetical protein WOLCODRAFT_14915 [Wolfiporia cocos MD-104 SS10]